jgi:hypothetical protein
MMGIKMESTVYVKGMRKRTESSSLMGMPSITEIQQCDLKRTIKINDRKRVYYIEPFVKDEEFIDEPAKPLKSAANNKNISTEKGGTIYLYHNITDTGERKKMFDFTARHVWSTQKMKPSPDACTMKDSLIIKTDGWYIDLPEFNCPVNYRAGSMTAANFEKPACMDKFVTKTSGKGKLGFPLIETTTMIMGGETKTSEFKTDLETLDFSTAKLDSTLFTIPAGYTEVKTEAELQDKFDMSGVMNQVKNMNKNTGNDQPVNPEQKQAGIIRIAVFEPRGEGVTANELQQFLVTNLTGGKIQAMAVSSEEDARRFKCDYTLNTEFSKIKQGSKVGGLLKAIKNTDPNAASSFTIENSFVLKSIGDGSVKLQQKFEGKYDGKLDDAAKKSLQEESELVMRSIN